jgi:hypothetical protein
MLGAPHPMDAHRVDSRGIQIRGRSKDVQEGCNEFLGEASGCIHRTGDN